MNRDADVKLLDELLKPRQCLRRGVARDNHRDACSLTVFELGPDVRLFIFRKIDSSSSMKTDTRCGIVCERGRLLLRIEREMIFDVLRIQREHIELLHETDQLRTRKVTKRIASQAQTNRRRLDICRASLSQCEDVA